MTRVYTKVGDIFSAKISAEKKKYFQYITNDLTQLNSDVIRAFRKEYPVNANPVLSEIVEDEVVFYAHCVTKWGVKLGYWEKVGNINGVVNIEHILFRDSTDYGNIKIKISENWWVWRINEDQKYVGKLEGENQTAEIGLVINPESIVYRLRTGEYDFKFYPGYK